MRDFLIALFSPSVWFQNHRYCAFWDSELKRLMASHKFENIDSYTATLGGVTIWIENHPYASMRPRHCDVRPKRATIIAAYEKLVRDTVEREVSSHAK